MGNPANINAATATKLATSLGMVDSVMGLAIKAISLARELRDATKAANPTAPDGSIPTDQQLIQKLLTDAQLLDREAAERVVLVLEGRPVHALRGNRARAGGRSSLLR